MVNIAGPWQRTCRVNLAVLALILLLLCDLTPTTAHAEVFRLTTFSADITIPLGHRCMGVLPTKSLKISDPLEAHGIVILGGNAPVVFVALDWCEVRNGAYDQWRDALAQAAHTTRERVLVCSIHQHDAPVTDADAARLLQSVDLANELYDEQFQVQTIERVAAALRESLQKAVPLTHIGTGQAQVENVGSNRRVVRPDGRVTFERGSRSGSDSFHAQAPEGEIDPFLKTLSFWNGEQAVAAISVYATHPMSYYGQGEVSADFVGLARRQRQTETPGIKQIYASGCSGDVTAGKYNDGSPANRVLLTNRMHAGMLAAWDATRKFPISELDVRIVPLQLPYYTHEGLRKERLEQILRDKQQSTEERILAAMGLASWKRVESGQPIDFVCLDFGAAQLVLFPGESFVGYQLLAQQMRPDSFVVSVGYGECWPGYVPTNAAFADGFHDKWLWVGPGSEEQMQRGLKEILLPK